MAIPRVPVASVQQLDQFSFPGMEGDITQDELGFTVKLTSKQTRRFKIRVFAASNQWEARYPTSESALSAPRTELLNLVLTHGMAPALRGTLWLGVLADLPGSSACTEVYEDLVLRANALPIEVRRQIDVDLPRTFADQRDFRAALLAAEVAAERAESTAAIRPSWTGGDTIHDRLRRVLGAYCIAHPLTGYLQSMNFVAGIFLLLYGDERRTFTAFQRLTLDLLRGYYDGDMRNMRADCDVFKAVLRNRQPELCAHLVRLGLDDAGSTLFLPRWLLCLFLNCFPAAVTLRVWDVLMLQGTEAPRFLLEVALAVFAMCHEPLLAARTFGDAVAVLKSIGTYVEDAAELLLLTRTPECSLQHTSILSLRAMYAPDFADVAGAPGVVRPDQSRETGPSPRVDEESPVRLSRGAKRRRSDDAPVAPPAAELLAASPQRRLRLRTMSNVSRGSILARSPGSPAAVDIDSVMSPPFVRQSRSPHVAGTATDASLEQCQVDLASGTRSSGVLPAALSPDRRRSGVAGVLPARVRQRILSPLVPSPPVAPARTRGQQTLAASRVQPALTSTPPSSVALRLGASGGASAPTPLPRTSSIHDPLTGGRRQRDPMPHAAAAATPHAAAEAAAALAGPRTKTHTTAPALELSPATPPVSIGASSQQLAASINTSISASVARRQRLKEAVRVASRGGKGGAKAGVTPSGASSSGLLRSPAATPLATFPTAGPAGRSVTGLVHPRFSTQYQEYDPDAVDPRNGDEDVNEGQDERAAIGGHPETAVREGGPQRVSSRLRSTAAAGQSANFGTAADARSVQLAMLSPPRLTPLTTEDGR